MTADYPPGTVATATVRGVEGARVFRVSADVWYSAEETRGHRNHYDSDGVVTDVRPLVVLDLDDPRVVWAYLCSAAAESALSVRVRNTCKVIADQIEAQTRPAIPEPQGRYAVVVDADGEEWVRWSDEWWMRYTDGDEGWAHREWSELAPVRVLSEGVTE